MPEIPTLSKLSKPQKGRDAFLRIPAKGLGLTLTGLGPSFLEPDHGSYIFVCSLP